MAASTSVWDKSSEQMKVHYGKPKENVGLLRINQLALEACQSALPAEDKPIILDVASALGEPAFTIAQALPHAVVHATDYSEMMVQKVQDRIEGEFAGKCLNVIAAKADGTDLNQFADSSVDAVTCSFGIMFMPAWQKAISEFYRVLKLNGVVFITLWGTLDQCNLIKMSTTLANSLAPDFQIPVDPTCRSGGTPPGQDVADTMADAGFSNVQLFERECTFKAASVDELYTKFVANAPCSGAIAAAEKAGNSDAVSDARKLYGELVKEAGIVLEDGSISSTHNTALILIGRKGPSPL